MNRSLDRMVRLALVCLVTGLVGCAETSLLRYPPTVWQASNDRTPFLFDAKPSSAFLAEITEDDALFQIEQLVEVSRNPFGFSHKLFTKGRQEALNTNNFDETFDSTWFTNRAGRLNPAADPSWVPPATPLPIIASGALTVSSIIHDAAGNSIEATDAAGRIFLVHVDPPDQPNLATGTSFVTRNILSAAGYRIAPFALIPVDPGRFRLARDAQWRHGAKRRAALPSDLDHVFAHGVSATRGMHRALVTQIPDGVPLGPSVMQGRRSGDENDRIPHEHRRELRGLRIFAAWLDMPGFSEADTLDLFVPERGAPQNASDRKRFGHIEHVILHTSSGIALPQSPANDPLTFTPHHSMGAFERMTYRDAIWAAGIMHHIPDAAIRTWITQASFGDTATAARIASNLADRRQRIESMIAGKISPLDDVRLDDRTVSFRNPFSLNGDIAYRYRVRSDRGRVTDHPWTEFQDARITLASDHWKIGRIYTLEVEMKNPASPWWDRPLDIFLERSAEGKLAIVGTVRR